MNAFAAAAMMILLLIAWHVCSTVASTLLFLMRSWRDGRD